MMIYRSKYLAMKAANDNQIAIRVEGGFMLISIHEYKRLKKRK